MSSKVHCDPFYFHFQTRPKLNKYKIQDYAQKSWEISPAHFHKENVKKKSVFDSKPVFLRKELSNTKKKEDKVLQENIQINVFKSPKRKPFLNTDIYTNCFPPFNKEAVFCNIPEICALDSPEKQRKKFSKKRSGFDLCDIKESFYNKKPCFELNPDVATDFKILEPQSVKKINCESQLLTNKSIKFSTSFSSNNVTKITPANISTSSDNSSGNSLSFFSHGQFSKFPLNLVQTKTNSNFLCSNNFRTSETANLEKLILSNSASSLDFDSNNTLLQHGSRWVQDLHWSTEEQIHSERNKKVTVLQGGYAEQLLKLQRRELAEKAFYEHDSGNKKNLDSLNMVIIAILQMTEIVVAKCLSDFSFSNAIQRNVENSDCKDSDSMQTKESPGYEKCIVLFQEKSFCKEHLKCGKTFSLFQPWHYLELKSLQWPVIVCTHFKTAASEFNEAMEMECTKLNDLPRKNCFSVHPFLQNNANNSNKFYSDDMFFEWNKKVSLTARIQRVWKRENCSPQLCELHVRSILNQNGLRLSLLLQSKDRVFYELIYSCHQSFMPHDWFKYILESEGKCYRFINLKVVHRLQRKRYPKLFEYIEIFLEQNTTGKLNQDFIYQLAFDTFTTVPSEMNEMQFPVHTVPCIQPLALLQNDYKFSQRFSCKSKVLCQYKHILYIYDESLLHSSSLNYIKVLLPEAEVVTIRSEILIKEAVIFEGALQVDEFSQISALPNKESLHDLQSITLNDLNLCLKSHSKISDLVRIEGKVVNVDERDASAWLQCCLCKKDNLMQRLNNDIYCEDCSAIVSKPLLKVKMTVTVTLRELPNILGNVQLLCQTIKKIIPLDENSYPPQCNIDDVLGKKVGPLLCYVRGKETTNRGEEFFLTEVEPN